MRKSYLVNTYNMKLFLLLELLLSLIIYIITSSIPMFLIIQSFSVLIGLNWMVNGKDGPEYLEVGDSEVSQVIKVPKRVSKMREGKPF